jgi:Carboxypeptidase regulatory-like domain
MPRLLTLLLVVSSLTGCVQLAAQQDETKTIEVSDRATAKPIAGATVVNAAGDAEEGQYTDRSGHAHIHDLTPGKHQLTINADGYETLTVDWDPSSGPTVFQLTPGSAANAAPAASTNSQEQGSPGAGSGSQQQSPGSDTNPPQSSSNDSSMQASAPGASGDNSQNPGSDWKSSIYAFASSLFFALLPVLAYFGVREVAVRTMAHFMMSRGSGAKQAEPAPAAAGAPTPAPALDFLEINTLNGILLSGPAETRFERAETTQRRKLNTLLLSFLAQFLVLLAVIAVLALIAWRLPGVRTNLLQHVLQAPLPLIFAAVVLLLTDLLVPFYGWTTYLQGVRIIELFAVFTAIVTIAFAAVTIYAGYPFFLSLVPVAAQLVVLVSGWRKIRRAAREDGNRKVVILRVFGSDKNAAFTFGNLMSKWRFIGSYLTIADPAYIRYQFSVLSRDNAGKSLGTVLTFGTLIAIFNAAIKYLAELRPDILPASWQSLPAPELQTRVQAIAYVVMAILATVPLMLYIRRRFLKVPDQAVNFVARLKNAGLGVESDYPGSALFCFDDVWKPAVHKMLEVADVVLMDLRGFSAARQGCAYEVGELIDLYPVDRLLFLIDAKTPKELLYTLIRERWSKMKPESPNRARTKATVNIYETGNRDKRDLPRIKALLSAALQGRVHVDNVGLAHWV